MGLLDALFSGSPGGYGGLLDSLMYPSPLTQKQPEQQPQYDQMGGYTGITPQTAPDPFGPPPQMASWAQQFAPQSAFNGTAPTAPIQFAGGQPQAPAMPPPQNVAPAPQPAQDMPLQNTQIGGYQMPQFGSAGDYTPQPQTAQAPSTDISAQSRAPQQSEQPLPPAFGGGSILGRIGSPDGLIARLTGNDSRSISQQNLTAQYNAIRQTLQSNGDTPQAAASKAMIAVMNPEAAKTILPELFTNKEKYGVISDNPIEGKKYGFVNELSQTINGKPLGEGGVSGQGGGMLAPGVQLDASKTGDDYLNQFSPEVKAAVKSYMNGDVQTTGNPRAQGIATLAKTVAQKYGADMGIPVSDTLYAEKRKYRTELGTNSANSAGGQAKAFNQGIAHMTSLADNLEKLDNSNGLGIPVLAQGANAVRQGFSNQQSAIADEAKSIGQTVAGEVGKLFSGSAGGGVHEREMTRERFDTIKSKPQLAAALRATLETMQGGLQALEQRRDSILGPNSGVDLVSDTTKQNIAKIQGAINRLEGKSPAMSGGLPSGWSVKVH